MLLLPIAKRERVLLVFKSLVSSHDFLNQALAQRFAAFMLEAVPNHVVSQLRKPRTCDVTIYTAEDPVSPDDPST